MRKMKKFLAILLASTMTLGMAMTANAAEGTDGKYGTADDTGIITVSGITPETGLKVLAHPIVEAKYENSGSFSGYEAIYGADTVTINPTTGDITISDAQMTALLAEVDSTKALEMDKSADGTVYTKEVSIGSYLVQIKNAETKIYGNVVVSVKYDRTEEGQTALYEANVDVTSNYSAGQPKVQSLPTIDKNIIENKGEENKEVKNGNTVDFGETVDYEIRTAIPYYGGAYPVYKITDSLTGLTLNGAPAVTVGENTLAVGTDYTYTPADNGFVLDFVVGGEYTLNEYQGQELLVEYSATVNRDAALNNAGNLNDATLDFTRDSKVEGNVGSVNDKTKSYTFDIDAVGEGALTTNIITKYGQDTTTTTKKLENAEFTLYTDEACTEKYENTGWNGIVKSDKDGQLTMKGLDEGIYYLKETKAPLGYTINNTVYKITITANIDTNGELTSWEIKVFDTTIANSEGVSNTFTVNLATKEVSKVINETGIQNTKIVSLPSTGGIGTTIFTVAGCGIMIAAAFFFFTGRKKEEN